MKKLILLVSILAAQICFANTVESVYKKDSLLPTSLQYVILAYLNANCAKGLSPYGLTEESTAASTEVEGATSYSTVFTSAYFFDGMHPSKSQIVVESAAIHHGSTIIKGIVDSRICE